MKKVLKLIAVTAVLGVGIGTCDIPLPGNSVAARAPAPAHVSHA